MIVPLVEEAVCRLLASPDPSDFSADANRHAAAAEMQAREYSVHVGSRPQGGKPLAITVERVSGTPVRNVDSATGRAQTVVDLTYWSRDTSSNRSNLRGCLELMHLCQVVLVGLRAANVADVQIAGIVLESEPIQTDEAPVDASDGWDSRISVSYLIYWRKADATNVAIEV